MREDMYEPQTLHEALLLESLMYHISIARVFAQDLGIPDDAICKIQEVHNQYVVSDQEVYRTYRKSMFCGMTPVISQILDQVGRSMRGDLCLNDLVALQSSLQAALNSTLTVLGTCSSQEEITLSTMPFLYLISAQLLLLSVSGYPEDVSVREAMCQALFTEGATRLASMIVFPTIVFFPVTIIGTLAMTTDERHSFRMLLEVSGSCISKSVQCVHELWDKAWKCADTETATRIGGSRIGALRVLSDSFAMENVIL